MGCNRRDVVEDMDEDTRGQLKQNSLVLKSLSRDIRYGGSSLKNIPALIKKVIREGIWKRYIDSLDIIEFDTFEEFVTTRLPEGLGATVEQIMALCEKDREALDLIDQELTRKPGNPNGNNQYETKESGINDSIMNSTSEHKATQGTSVEYTLRRLRKDHPELHEKVLANKMSPNAAAIEAGFRKHTITVTVDVEAIARKLRRTLDQDQIQQLIDLLKG